MSYNLKNNILERFLRYVKYDTSSDKESGSNPSTDNQMVFAKILAEELEHIGLTDVKVSEKAYVTALLPSNSTKKVPTIGFIAHLDTSQEMCGLNIKPKVIENFNGKYVFLNEKENIILQSSDFPNLANYKGKTLIVTDGTTLLGADDKAGISEIITAFEYLIVNRDLEHGDIRVCFTPDEEIGEGANHFDVEYFKVDFAYTIDGGVLGELQYENFNAAEVLIEIYGRNIHPGYAKNKMLNASLIACQFDALLPNEKPENTENYEGFYHLNQITGTVDKTQLNYIIRDHDKAKFDERKNIMKQAIKKLSNIYPIAKITCSINDQYYNMKEIILSNFHIVELAKQSMIECGVTPIIEPIRGGTDGSRLSYMGLPCPNIFVGAENSHSRYEFACIEDMTKATEVIIKIITK